MSVYITVSISTSGTNAAGETYSLVCSVTVNGSSMQPTITWSGVMNSPVPPEMVTTTGSMSTVMFNMLSPSHVGTYTCTASVGGKMQSDIEMVSVLSEWSTLCIMIV